MRPRLLDFALAFLLLASGVTAAASGVAGVIRDLTAAVPGGPSPTVHLSEGGWWLRRCLVAPECSEAIAALLRASAAAHGRVLGCGLLVVVASLAWLGTLRLRSIRPPRSIGDARFASLAELRHLARRSPKAWFPLGYARRWPLPGRLRRAMAFSTAVKAWAHPVRLPEEDLARHVLVLGLTGAHKTTSVTFPVLLEAAHAEVSVVALDLKYGEEDSLARVAPEWLRCRRDVLVFAPVDPMSLRWNPLAGCRTLGEAHRLATLLFDDADATDPDQLYWVGAERHVCAALIFAIATDGGLPTFERLRALCAAGPGPVHGFVQTHPASPSLVTHLGAYRAMLAKDEAGILQGIASRLEAWSDETVCRATGGGDACEQIDLGRLRREPVLLIVGVPQAARSRLRWLCHLFLRDLASCLLRPRGPGEEVQVLQVLEELPAWGPLPGLADHLATFRSRHVSVLATIQSEAQGVSVYGFDGWAAVAANLVTKIYFSSLADLDAERLSRVLGTAGAEEVARSRGWGAGGQRGQEQRRHIPIPLQRPEELQGIGSDEDEIIVRCSRLPPARLWCPPFFARAEYRGRVSDLPPSTADLVVYHHLRHRSIHAPRQIGHHVVPTKGSNGETTPVLHSRPPETGTVIAADVATGQDIEILTQFVEGLLSNLVAPRPPDAPRPVARSVLRGGRLVEVRIDSEMALRFWSDPVTTSAIMRRWAALRWVRRIRPVFVLERRALEALDTVLRRRLLDACSTEPG